MTSILVSSDDHGVEQALSQQIASTLGLRFVGPELLAVVAQKAGVTEESVRSILDGTTRKRAFKTHHWRLLCQLQEATLLALLDDGVVSAGLGAHLYVNDVSHIIKLRLLSSTAERSHQADGNHEASEKGIARLLGRLHPSRVSCSQELFGVDEQDPSLYDMVIHLKQIQPDRVIEIVRDMAQFRGFQPMTYSRRCLEDQVLACKVRLELLDDFPQHVVKADGSRVVVCVKCSERQRTNVIVRIKDKLKPMESVGLVEVHTVGSLKALDSWICP